MMYIHINNYLYKFNKFNRKMHLHKTIISPMTDVHAHYWKTATKKAVTVKCDLLAIHKFLIAIAYRILEA